MTNDIETYIKNTYKEFQYSSYTVVDFVDITLSLLMWKVLSDETNGRGFDDSPIEWRSPGDEHLFDVVLAHADKRNIKYEFELSTEMWERENPEHLRGLLKIDINQLSYIPHERWINICHLWKKFFNHRQLSASDYKETIVKAFDLLELFLSERMETTEMFTPRQVVDLMVEFASGKPGEDIYDPFCRSGDMLATAATHLSVKRANGITPTKISWKLARLRMLLLDTEVNTSIERHGSLYLPERKGKYDFILLNPPFGIVNEINKTLQLTGVWSRLIYGTNRIDLVYLAYALDCLNDKGSAAAIMPNIFLSGQGMIKELRKKMIDDNLLEAVVTLPPKIFPKTGVSAVILFFNKKKKREGVFMLNASELVHKKEKQFYLKGDVAIELFKRRDTLDAGYKDDHVVFVSNEEIAAHDHDLQFSSYKCAKASFLEGVQSSEKLMMECKHLEAELSEVKERLAQLIASYNK